MNMAYQKKFRSVLAQKGQKIGGLSRNQKTSAIVGANNYLDIKKNQIRKEIERDLDRIMEPSPFVTAIPWGRGLTNNHHKHTRSREHNNQHLSRITKKTKRFLSPLAYPLLSPTGNRAHETKAPDPLINAPAKSKRPKVRTPSPILPPSLDELAPESANNQSCKRLLAPLMSDHSRIARIERFACAPPLREVADRVCEGMMKINDEEGFPIEQVKQNHMYRLLRKNNSALIDAMRNQVTPNDLEQTINFISSCDRRPSLLQSVLRVHEQTIANTHAEECATVHANLIAGLSTPSNSQVVQEPPMFLSGFENVQLVRQNSEKCLNRQLLLNSMFMRYEGNEQRYDYSLENIHNASTSSSFPGLLNFGGHVAESRQLATCGRRKLFSPSVGEVNNNEEIRETPYVQQKRKHPNPSYALAFDSSPALENRRAKKQRQIDEYRATPWMMAEVGITSQQPATKTGRNYELPIQIHGFEDVPDRPPQNIDKPKHKYLPILDLDEQTNSNRQLISPGFEF